MSENRTDRCCWEYIVLQYVGSIWNNKGEWSRADFEDFSTEQALNHLGAEGWELVSLGPVHGEQGKPSAAYIFKRPII
ncbi:DUF4177 domain-containing protein [Sphingorhabdus arenilitoris]|uniref:DUF4177 domain-containing protein n=1 Tax=Sphingorhabdus arenilitoris TaxID=1490041 RepID=A0ABV8RFN2_9SPHN